MALNKFNIRILHNNFDILRKQHHLKKGQFCKIIGIANAYRTDYSSIGAKLLKGIADNFSGIDEAWLLEPHDLREELLKSHYIEPAYNQTSVNESWARYGENAELLKKIQHTLKSNTVYGTALKDIIEAYYAAVTCQEDLSAANKNIDKLKEEMSEVKNRLPAVGE